MHAVDAKDVSRPDKRRRVLLCVAGVAACVAAAACAWRAGSPPRHPLQTAYWYWHHPYRLSSAERARLVDTGVSRLYVHAGTLQGAGVSRLRLAGAQQWPPASPVETWAVFRVHPGALGPLLAPGGAERAIALLREAHLPPYVRGVQWDVDVPTKRLRDYTRFLSGTRLKLRRPGGARLGQGVTALPDWLRVADYQLLCGAVDEVAPQFYGNRWPEPGKNPPALWEFESMLRGAATASAGARTWIGLPAYGRCLLTDAEGRPAGVRHDLDGGALLDDPSWHVRESGFRSAPLLGRRERQAYEDTVALTCDTAAPAGPLFAPPGTTLWFQWPRRAALRRSVDLLRDHAPPGVEGVCLFRWPAPGEPLALPVVDLSARHSSVVKGGIEAADENRAAGLLLDLRGTSDRVDVRVVNTGDDSPPPGELILLTVFPGGGTLSTAGTPRWQRGGEPVSELRADRALLARPFLRPGRAWEACRVARSPRPVRAVLRWRGEDGVWREVTAASRSEDGLSASTAQSARGARELE